MIRVARLESRVAASRSIERVNIQHIISHLDGKNHGRKELNVSYRVVVVVNQPEELAENLVKCQDRGGTRGTGPEGHSLEWFQQQGKFVSTE